MFDAGQSGCSYSTQSKRHGCKEGRLVQSFQLSLILIILLYYRYIHFLFSNTQMKAKTLNSSC